jgi:hypothetical protein
MHFSRRIRPFFVFSPLKRKESRRPSAAIPAINLGNFNYAVALRNSAAPYGRLYRKLAAGWRALLCLPMTKLLVLPRSRPM